MQDFIIFNYALYVIMLFVLYFHILSKPAYTIILWTKLFKGTVPANKNYVTGTVPANKDYVTGTVKTSAVAQ